MYGIKKSSPYLYSPPGSGVADRVWHSPLCLITEILSGLWALIVSKPIAVKDFKFKVCKMLNLWKWKIQLLISSSRRKRWHLTLMSSGFCLGRLTWSEVPRLYDRLRRPKRPPECQVWSASWLALGAWFSGEPKVPPSNFKRVGLVGLWWCCFVHSECRNMVERMLASKSIGPSCGASQVDPNVTSNAKWGVCQVLTLTQAAESIFERKIKKSSKLGVSSSFLHGIWISWTKRRTCEGPALCWL